MFDGFSQEIVTTGEGAVYLRRRGTGPPVLLLHGFPETHVAWHLVAPALLRGGDARNQEREKEKKDFHPVGMVRKRAAAGVTIGILRLWPS